MLYPPPVDFNSQVVPIGMVSSESFSKIIQFTEVHVFPPHTPFNTFSQVA